MKKLLIATTLVLGSFTATADDLVIATGSEGGGYEKLGYEIAKSVSTQVSKSKGKVELDIEVVNSTGSVENLEMFNDGDVQIAIVQGDSLSLYPPSKSFKSKTAHTEVVYWFLNKKNDIEDLSDLEGDTDKLVVIVEGSGAEVTWHNFAKEDTGYKVNVDKGTIYADDLYEAFEIVSEGIYEGKTVAGLLYVTKSGKISPELRADFGKKVVIGEATDSDFNDAKDENGNSLYTTCEVDKKGAANFETVTTFSPDTICMKAKVIYSDDFEDKKTKRVISKGITKALK